MKHTLAGFDDQIAELRGLISDIGGRAEVAIEKSMVALTRHDLDLAREVVLEDKKMDELEIAIERLAVQIMTMRAPMAGDLRETVAALKIAGAVERVGDYAKNIAKRVPQISRTSNIEATSILPSMAQLASNMLRDVLNAFAARDWEAAVSVCNCDGAVDDFYSSIFRTLLTSMTENPATIAEAAHLLFIAKNLERIGDHATNVAEMVYFAAKGEHMADRERGRANWGDFA